MQIETKLTKKDVQNMQQVKKMEVRILNADPLIDYKQACLITQGKTIHKCTEPENEREYWIKQILANHSTIRSIHFRIIDEIPRSCVMQIIRATKGHPQPYVCSSRPDWNNGKERSNDPYEPKLFAMDFTPESFVDMCKQRLCQRTEDRTRKVVTTWVRTMINSKDPLISAIAECCKPACVYNGRRCPEIKGCGFYPPLSDFFINGVK